MFKTRGGGAKAFRTMFKKTELLVGQGFPYSNVCQMSNCLSGRMQGHTRYFCMTFLQYVFSLSQLNNCRRTFGLKCILFKKNINGRMRSHTSCICSIFHIRIGCIFGFFPLLCLLKCLVKFFAWQDGTSHSLHLFGFSVVCFSNVSSNGMTGRMQIHASCICSIFHICIGCIFLLCNSLCIFKGLLKFPAREKTYSHFLAFLQCVFQMNPQITCHN